MIIMLNAGNAITEMSANHAQGAPQANGQILVEPMMDVKHVADAIVHIAGLPLNVTVLTFNIMYVRNLYF